MARQKEVRWKSNLREYWEEENWSHQPDGEEVEDEHAMLKKMYHHMVAHR